MFIRRKHLSEETFAFLFPFLGVGLRACDAEAEPPQTQEPEDAGARHRAASVFPKNHGTMTDLPDQIIHTVPRANPGLRLWETSSEAKEADDAIYVCMRVRGSP
jgi:hypothetical protein